MESKIIGEIEAGLDLAKWSRESTLDAHVIIDFMFKMRQMSLVQLSTLGDVINAIISSASEQDEALAEKYLVVPVIDFSFPGIGNGKMSFPGILGIPGMQGVTQ